MLVGNNKANLEGKEDVEDTLNVGNTNGPGGGPITSADGSDNAEKREQAGHNAETMYFDYILFLFRHRTFEHQVND